MVGFMLSNGLLLVILLVSAVSFIFSLFVANFLLSFILKGHDSTVTIMDTHSGVPTVLKLRELPLCDLVWVNENTLVGAGHNNFPRTFIKNQQQRWVVGKNLDEQKATGPAKTTGTRAAFNMFQSKVETGQNSARSTLKTKHQNFVNCVQGSAGSAGNYSAVSTTGLDGKLIIWKM